MLRNRGIGRPTIEDTRNARVRNDTSINFNSSIVVESVQFSVTEEKLMRFLYVFAGAFSAVTAVDSSSGWFQCFNLSFGKKSF
ncbi:MAG: hypothetical protein J1D86_08140 [Alistipes sp.]|nr:hypothetical protein [Alistipes sp.]